MDGRKLLGAVAAMVVAISMGCGGKIEPFGQAVVALQWEVAPLGCEAAGVEDVEVVMENDRRMYQERFRCDRSTVLLDGIKPGSYALRLAGRDGDDRVTHRGAIEDFFVRPDGRTKSGTIDLVAVPAGADVSWWFEDPRICREYRVREVEVTVFDEAHHEVHRATVDCDREVYPIRDLRTGEHLFRIRATEDGDSYQGIAEAVLKRGDTVAVDIGLNATATH